jgi:erythromycin esterase-like protein
MLLGSALAGAAALTVSDAAADAPTPAPVERQLLDAALANLHPMSFDGTRFSGPGWDLVEAEARSSEFVLLGEEHGTAEIPKLAGALFAAIRPAGFDTLGIEISPQIAEDLDRAARSGVEGIKAFADEYPPGPAFYFWRTEAELIASVRASTTKDRPALWGIDYEVTGDRRLIARLRQKAPVAARPALEALDAASQKAWATWRSTHNPGALFTFSGDPELVRVVRKAWPKPDEDVLGILHTLEETLEVNRRFPGRFWESNERRSQLMRANLRAYLDHAARQGRRPKVMFKMGETHMMRGVTTTGNFDVGSMIVEAAELRGGKAFSVIAGGGRGSFHGVLNPTNMTTAPAPVSMLDDFMGLGFLTAAVTAPGPQVVDLRPLRPIVANEKRLKTLNNPEGVRAIFAFDALLIWNGTTPAQMLREA